ncbi:hypothetical protein BS17DRAFT_685179, partial [Gyrodon lividus]
DNGKLRCGDLQTWLLSQGMSHQFPFISAHTSAQNGCVEHIHHTLMGKAQAM